MVLSASNVLQIVILTQMAFSALLLRNTPRFSALTLLVSCTGLLMLFNLLEETGTTSAYYLVTPIFSLAKGPLFYLVVMQAIDSEMKLNKHSFIHLLPALLALTLTNWPQFVLLLGSISAVGYFGLCIRRVAHYHKLRAECRSDAQTQQLAWLSGLLIVMVSFSLVDLVRLNLQPYLPYELLRLWYFLMQMGFFIILCIIVIKAIRQPELFAGLNTIELSLLKNHERISDANEATAIFNELDALIKTKYLYRQPRLSLRDLAEISGLNERDISWAINTGGQQNFCDYINGLRIQEVKDTLRGNLTKGITKPLIELAIDVGFNSKSTFNATFKREAGVTPSQYIKSLSAQ